MSDSRQTQGLKISAWMLIGLFLMCGGVAHGASESRYAGASAGAWSADINARGNNDFCASQSTFFVNLDLTVYGFSIPAWATITGIVVEVRAARGSSVSGMTAQLRRDGGLIGASKPLNPVVGNCPDVTANTLGADGDLWGGVGWTPAHVNASDFGVTINSGTSLGGDTQRWVRSVQITVYYTPDPATIEVRKALVPTSDNGRFNLLIGGTVHAADAGHNSTTGAITVAPGSYTVSETASAGTDLAGYSTTFVATRNGTVFSTGSGTTVPSFTAASGDAIVVTFTNTRNPTIEVRKSLSPTTDGGLFNLRIAGVNYATNVGHDGTTGAVVVAPGSYSMSETAGTGTDLADYTTTYSVRKNGVVILNMGGTSTTGLSVSAGDVLVVTFFNTVKAPPPTATIEVKKTVSPTDDGGLFDLWIGATVRATDVGHSGTTGSIVVDADTNYTASESAGTGTDLANYIATWVATRNGTEFASGAGTNVPSFLVSADDVVVVTFTNTRASATINVTKSVAGIPPGTAWEFNGTAPIGVFTLPAGGGGPSTHTVPAGVAYTVTETTKPGYAVEHKVDGGPAIAGAVATVTPTAGQTIDIEFINTAAAATINVTKTVIGAAPATGWEFNGTAPIGAFTLPAGGGGPSTHTVPAGVAYTVTETTKPGYVVEHKVDGGPAIAGAAATVTPTAGQTIDIEFINTESPAPPPRRPTPIGGGGPANVVPIASAGPDQVVCVGERVYLNASHSYDPDGISGEERIAHGYAGRPTVFSDLAFDWAFSTWYYRDSQAVPHHPEGSNVAITMQSFDKVFASFIPDLPGDYVLRVIVSDGEGEWSVDQIRVHAKECDTCYTCWYEQGWNLVSVPVQPVDPNPQQVVGPTSASSPSVTYMAGYSPAVDRLMPTQGFWVHFPHPENISVIGREIDADVSFWLDDPGWHLISAPFTYPWDKVFVKVDGVERFIGEAVSRPLIDNICVCYDPVENAYRDAALILPCQGYWIRTHVPNVQLILKWNNRVPSRPPTEYGCHTGFVTDSSPPNPPVSAMWTATSLVTTLAYPNPVVHGTVTFELNALNAQATHLKVFTAAGQVIWQSDVLGSSVEWDPQTTSGQRLPSGPYLYCFYDASSGRAERVACGAFFIVRTE